MAKNKRDKAKEEEVEKDEVTYEEEVGGEGSGDDGEQKEGFFAKNRFYIIAAVVILLGAFLYNRYSGSRGISEDEMDAQGILARAEYQFERDSIRLAINGDGQYPGFQAVVDDYPGTDAANIAQYYLGLCYLKIGDIATGTSYLEEYSQGDNQVAAAANAAMGYAYEQQNNFAAAAEAYEKASTIPEENPYTTPFYLMDAARVYEAAGNTAKALETYQRIRNDYPNSQDVLQGNVDRHIAKLDAGA